MNESVILSSTAVAVLARAKDALECPSLDHGEWVAVDTDAENEAADALTEGGFLECKLTDEGVMLFRATDAGLVTWFVQAGARRQGVTK